MNSRYDESNKEPHVCKESDKNFQETQTDDAELATLPPPPLPFGYTIQELMSHNHELQTQKEQLEMKNKAMKNQLKTAQATLNQKKCKQDSTKFNVPTSNIAGLKCFVANIMWKKVKYLNEQSFDNNPKLVERCYTFMNLANLEHKGNFYLHVTRIVKQKMVDMRKHHRSVLKTLVIGKFFDHSHKILQSTFLHNTKLLFRLCQKIQQTCL